MENEDALQMNIDEFVEERLQESYKNISNNEHYKKILKKYYSLFDNIISLVNNEGITEKYREAEFDVYAIQLKEAYKTGFYDSTSIFINKK